MILLDVKDYMAQVGSCNLTQVSQHFNVAPDAMRGLLQHWIRKGCIKPTALPNNCGSACQQCTPLLREMYCYNQST